MAARDDPSNWRSPISSKLRSGLGRKPGWHDVVNLGRETMWRYRPDRAISGPNAAARPTPAIARKTIDPTSRAPGANARLRSWSRLRPPHARKRPIASRTTPTTIPRLGSCPSFPNVAAKLPDEPDDASDRSPRRCVRIAGRTPATTPGRRGRVELRGTARLAILAARTPTTPRRRPSLLRHQNKSGRPVQSPGRASRANRLGRHGRRG
jgi:hypothetical protein